MFKYPKTRKIPSQISAPRLVFVFWDEQFHHFQVENLHFCGILLFFLIFIVQFISFWVESVEKWNSYSCPELGVKRRCPELGANPCTTYCNIQSTTRVSTRTKLVSTSVSLVVRDRDTEFHTTWMKERSNSAYHCITVMYLATCIENSKSHLPADVLAQMQTRLSSGMKNIVSSSAC